MFEQASIDTRGALKSPWALAVSVTGQTIIISAGILFSLTHTDGIRPPASLTLISPPTVRHVSTAKQETVVRRTRLTPGVFTMPAQVPTSIDMTVRDPAPTVEPDFGSDIRGVAGVISATTGLSSFIDTITRQAPSAPPRAEVVQQKKPEVVAPRKPIPVSTGVQAAKLLRQVKPIYPQLARTARISGTVRLVAIIGKEGSIANLQVSAGHPLLIPAAVEAVKQWLYQPTLLNGEPVDVITQIDVNFTLSQ